MRRGFLYILLTFWILLLIPTQAYAQASPFELSIAPAVTEVELVKPDEEKELIFTLTNHTNSEITLDLFPLDFHQYDPFGSLTFFRELPENYSYSLSSFLSLQTDTIVLKPREKRDIRIEVMNRSDLSPGGHYAAIVARVQPDEADNKTNLTPSISALILLKKTGGERFNLSLKDVNFPNLFVELAHPSSLSILFQNEGNIHVVPYGRVEVRDIFNRLLYKGVLNIQSSFVFPQSRRYISADLKQISKPFPLSLNIVTIRGQDSLKKVTYSYKDTYLFIEPWLLIVLIVLLIIWIRKPIQLIRFLSRIRRLTHHH